MTARKLNFETPMTATEKLDLLNSTIAAESDAAKKKSDNEKFIKAFKKASGQKSQTVLPTMTNTHNEWAVREGWSICDAMHWRSLCERAKTAQDDIEGDSFLELLLGTIELAGRCESHPVGLIAYARTAFGAKTWDIDTLHMMMDNLLEEDGPAKEGPEFGEQVDIDDDDDDKAIPDGKRKRSAEAATAAEQDWGTQYVPGE